MKSTFQVSAQLVFEGIVALALVGLAVGVLSMVSKLNGQHPMLGVANGAGSIHCVESRTGFHWESSIASHWSFMNEYASGVYYSSDGKQFFPVPGSECELVHAQTAIK